MSKLMHYKVTYKFVDSDVYFNKYLLAEDHHTAAIKADQLKDPEWECTDVEPTNES